MNLFAQSTFLFFLEIHTYIFIYLSVCFRYLINVPDVCKATVQVLNCRKMSEPYFCKNKQSTLTTHRLYGVSITEF